jgi:hypothetical protein
VAVPETPAWLLVPLDLPTRVDHSCELLLILVNKCLSVANRMPHTSQTHANRMAGSAKFGHDCCRATRGNKALIKGRTDGVQQI